MKHPIPASATEVVETVARLSKATLSASARSEMEVLAEETLNPEFLADAEVTCLWGVLMDLEERVDHWVGITRDEVRFSKGLHGEPQAVKAEQANARRVHKAYKDAHKAVKEALQALGE